MYHSNYIGPSVKLDEINQLFAIWATRVNWRTTSLWQLYCSSWPVCFRMSQLYIYRIIERKVHFCVGIFFGKCSNEWQYVHTYSSVQLILLPVNVDCRYVCTPISGSSKSCLVIWTKFVLLSRACHIGAIYSGHLHEGGRVRQSSDKVWGFRGMWMSSVWLYQQTLITVELVLMNCFFQSDNDAGCLQAQSVRCDHCSPIHSTV